MKYCYLIMLVVLITACSDKLEQVNPNVLTEDTFWQTPEHFDQALVATYSALQYDAIWGSTKAKCMLRSDLFGTEAWYDQHYDITNFLWHSSDQTLLDTWAQPYIGIMRANQVMHYMNKCGSDAGLSTAEMDLMEAQARFIRAFLYFELIKNFNGAIIHDRFSNEDEDFYKPFSAKDAVLGQIIYPDLYMALKHLPPIWHDADDLGRITWGAAAALMGKVYLHQAEWDSAARYLGEVIESGLYELTTNPIDNFNEAGEFNSESIFEINFSPVSENESTDRDDPIVSIIPSFAPLGKGGYNTNIPTYWIQELFVSADSVDQSNTNYTAGNRYSNRTSASIAVRFSDGLYYGDTLDFNFNSTSPLISPIHSFETYVKKYTNWNHLEVEDYENSNSMSINYRNIRLADVYLMYAEAILERGGSSAADLQVAMELIDEIRERACTFTLMELIDSRGGIPRFDVSRFAEGRNTYRIVSVNRENLLRHIRMVERPLELAFEGHRWHDLVRWNLVQEVFNDRLGEEESIMNLITDGYYNYLLPEYSRTYPLYIDDHVRQYFHTSVENYIPGLPPDGHDYFMIPDMEEDLNRAL